MYNIINCIYKLRKQFQKFQRQQQHTHKHHGHKLINNTRKRAVGSIIVYNILILREIFKSIFSTSNRN